MKQKEKKILALAAMLCLASVVIMIAVLCISRQETAPFVPPEFDSNAQEGTPDVPDGLGWQELDAKAFRFCLCGRFSPAQNAAQVWLTNPRDNALWLKLRVLDGEGNILGETGLIKPGFYVREVTLNQMPAPGTEIVMKVMAYEPETYYSQGAVTLNTTVSAE